jgi:hypothetical protein
MANMIPDRIDPDAPSSERRVFDLLRGDPDTTGWIVLHSLGLAKRGKKPFGEIDFVVMVPDLGILCLEVKGGRITCEAGTWYTQDRNDERHELKRSPILQAREGAFALQAAIRERFGAGSTEASVMVGSAVVFPDVPSPPVGVEAERWEYLDRDLLSRSPISKCIPAILRHYRTKFSRADGPGPASATLKNIRTFLRPDFDIVVARGTTIERAEEHLMRLTDEQFDVLDTFGVNRRCVVDGAAGTGKTLVAIELARRARNQGMSPIVLCYNRLLGRWIESELEGIATAGTYHGVMRKLILESALAGEFQNKLDSAGQSPLFNEWPEYALQALGESGPIGDFLILDESQDLASDEDLCVLDAMLAGGLKDGRWVMVGDFVRQSIYDRAGARDGLASFEAMLRERAPNFAILKLSANCRNTRQIAEETAMLSGFENPPYRLNGVDGPPVDTRYWTSQSDQLSDLESALGALLRDGVPAERITILSMRRFERSVAQQLSTSGRWQICDITGSGAQMPSKDAIRFSTIHSFKGMETQVAVLVDLEGMDEPGRQALLYVGMSRARTCLVMLLHESFRPFVNAAFLRRIREH